MAPTVVSSRFWHCQQESQVNAERLKADDIFQWPAWQDDEKKYEEVKQNFGYHSVKRRNVIFKRSNFSSRNQEEENPWTVSYGPLHLG